MDTTPDYLNIKSSLSLSTYICYAWEKQEKGKRNTQHSYVLLIFTFCQKLDDCIFTYLRLVMLKLCKDGSTYSYLLVYLLCQLLALLYAENSTRNEASQVQSIFYLSKKSTKHILGMNTTPLDSIMKCSIFSYVILFCPILKHHFK